MRARPFSRTENKHLFAMLDGMHSEEGKRQVRHVEFAAERLRAISVVTDRVAFGLRGQFPRLEEGSGRLGAVLRGRKTESDGGSAQWVMQSSHK